MNSYSKGQYNGPMRGTGVSRFYGAPVTKWLMIAVVACLALDTIGGGTAGNLRPSFSLQSEVAYQVWRWVTYCLVDFNVIGVLFFLMVLYSFGRIVEQSLGSRRYGVLVGYCVLGAALIYLLMKSLTAGNGDLSGGGSVTIGLVVAAAVLYPEQKVQLMIPPVAVKLKHVAIFFVGFMVIMSIAQQHNPAMSLAHLSGVVVAYLCLKKTSLLDLGNHSNKVARGKIIKMKKAKAEFSKQQRQQKGGLKPRTVMNMSESKKEEEMNRILDKVSEEGVGSLTVEEKEILKFNAKDD